MLSPSLRQKKQRYRHGGEGQRTKDKGTGRHDATHQENLTVPPGSVVRSPRLFLVACGVSEHPSLYPLRLAHIIACSSRPCVCPSAFGNLENKLFLLEMQSEAERDALQGLESEIFKLVSYSAAPEQWAAWLKEPLKHALAGGGSAEMVDALRGASGLVRGDECKSYIHPYPKRACLQGFERDLFKLLSCAQAPEERAGWLRVPLEHAAACGNLELVDALLGAGANGGAGWRGCRGRTLLDAAALGGNADVVSALVGAGAGPDLNVSSVSSKRSALYTATFCGHEAAARRLVQAGADVNFQDPLDRLNVLHVAVEGGLDQLVKDLLLGGADVHVRDGDRGLTPVHIAAWAGHDRVLSTLFLLNGGDADARHKEHGICQSPR